MMELHKVFEDNNDEFLKFDRVEFPMHRRPDIAAFLLLDLIVPGKADMVSHAEHDEIWLDVDVTELAERATEKQVIDLIRCGVRYDSDYDALAMFV